MSWEPAGQTGIIPAHAALIPPNQSYPKGAVLYFGGYDPELPTSENNVELFDLNGNKIVPISGSPSVNIFCSGHAFLADGRLVVAGGWKQQSHVEGETIHGPVGHENKIGVRDLWIYHPKKNVWERGPDMHFEPGHESDQTGGGRWYPTVVPLANGDLIAFSGHPDETDTRHENNTPELYEPSQNKWDIFTNPVNSDLSYYPRAHLLPDNKLFFSSVVGPSDDKQHYTYDPYNGTFDDEIIPSHPSMGQYRVESARFSSVLLPLLLEDNYMPRILICGYEKAFKINLDDNVEHKWEVIDRNTTLIKSTRMYNIATILPTGDILVTGGTSEHGVDSTAEKHAEIYHPGIDFTTGLYSKQDEMVADPQNVEASNARGYHYVALLLPDGSVWNAGSTSWTQESGEQTAINHPDVEIYKPSYFSNLNRPKITNDSPGSISYGKTFVVETDQASSIQRIAIIRAGSVTHGFNPDQRYVGLKFTRNGNKLEVTAPPSSKIAPPGYYMLWIVDNQNIPCELAWFIRLVSQSCVIYNDVSTYSLPEAQALGVPGATFTPALYVIFDSFLPSEISSPVWTLRRPDNSPPPDVSLVLNKISYEAGSSQLDVTQRIAYTYDIKFDSFKAFDEIPAGDDSQDLTLHFSMGHYSCQTTLTLSKNPNPFMRDGDPPWISVDLRVFKTWYDDPGNKGIPHPPASKDAPFQYIKDLISHYNDVSGQPNHPFETKLPTTQESSKLALYSHDSSKTPPPRIYNYAVARVRLRAPEGITAHQVRVFFRLCITGWTGLEYDPNGSYKRHGTGPTATPLLGLIGGEINTIPCFAEPRKENMEDQQDTVNNSKDYLTGKGATEVNHYFGCYIDINDTLPLFPLKPSGNGPFIGSPTDPLLSIQQLMRGPHQCLIAEVHYNLNLIKGNPTPFSSDKLAQRNILFEKSENPGGFATHLVQHTFEIKPSPVPLSTTIQGGNFASTRGGDFLVIHWGNLPRTTHASLYLPDVDTQEILTAAGALGGPAILSAGEDHTLNCKITDIAFIPIPGPRDKAIPCLLTLLLPPDIVKGQRFSVVVQQAQTRRRRIIGTFQFDIIVSDANDIVPELRRSFSVLKYIGLSIPLENRWYPIFNRYLTQIGERLRAFGEDPDKIEPSSSGSGISEKPTSITETHELIGKVKQVLYDCFGDFKGFILEDCSSTYEFQSCEKHLEKVIIQACKDRATLSIISNKDEQNCILQIIRHCC